MSHKKHQPTSRRSSDLDFHHLLFQRRHWQQGWAKALREHPYCGGCVPQSTLHREIHAKVHDVPTPNGSDCKRILRTLDEWLANGKLSLDDRLDHKAQVLAELLANCPATSAILLWQSEIISKFYGR